MRVTRYLAVLLLVGCFAPSEGIAPPAEQIYFPTGLAIDSGGDHLFIANSDFDLQYTAGTLQSLKLGRLRAFIPRLCKTQEDCGEEQRCDLEPTAENRGVPSHFCVAQEGPAAGKPCALGAESEAWEQLLHPGRCRYLDPSFSPDGSGSLWADAVTIGASARDLIFVPKPSSFGEPQGAGRVFIPVGGDGTLHWAEIVDGRIECGQANNGGACDGAHRSKNNPESERTRQLQFPNDPFAVAATEDADALVVLNQSRQGIASLMTHDWSVDGPRLEYQIVGLPGVPTAITALPVPAVARARGVDYPPSFLATFAASRDVFGLRFHASLDSTPRRAALSLTGSVPINTNFQGVNTRSIAIDDTERKAREKECAIKFGITPECQATPECLPGRGEEDKREYKECVAEAAAIPLWVYVANRAPASLVIGKTRAAINATSNQDMPDFVDTVPLSYGPSRVVVGKVISAENKEETRVFVVCFDSRRIYIYDPGRRRLEAEVITGRGPQTLAVDAQHGLAYVGHFTDSYLGVISLDMRFPHAYGKMIAAVGRPTPPRASK